ncbi:aldehyde reductase [Cryomorphaceae bacterium]|nr:aldehyde reductase [Cryomorphaceae bacterium]
MKKVLLTGISGYIGQHCAVELLRHGYAVKGSVRNLNKAESISAHIERHVDPKGNLSYVELDLLSDKGWDAALEGVDFVMHVASPFVSREPKNENELIKPAVEGTMRALQAAKKAGIKRVVLTSSMVAMLGDLNGDMHINDKSWTELNAKHITAYLKSKTMAEQAAWKFIEEQEGEDRMELVTVHPGPVYGPTLSDNLNGESMSLFKGLITGKIPRLMDASINMSDVRDVAKIHVLALENEKAANRRFIVASEKSYSYKDLAQVLSDNDFDRVGTKLAPTFLIKLLAKVSSEYRGYMPYVGKAYQGNVQPTMETFDWTPMPFDKMIVDTGQSVQRVLSA